MKKTIYLLTLWTLAITANAQTRNIVRRYVDSLKVAETKCKEVETASDANPYYFQMFFPGTYYSNVTKNVLSLDSIPSQYPIDMQILNLQTSQPSVATHYDSQFGDEKLIDTSKKDVKPTDDIKNELKNVVVTPIKDETAMEDMDIDLQIHRPNFWTTSGSAKLQFTQNYFSENWYRGGNNNGTLLATLTLKANYNDTKRLTWENTLDMRLGFITTTSDTCHTFLTNNDRIQFNSKLGYKAVKYWSYTISTEAKTQFLPGYRSNNRLKFSQFIAPLDVAVSVGMDFKPNIKNGSLSVALLPLSYKLRYIGTDNENIHKTYNFVGRSTSQDYGSRIEVNTNIKLHKNITWRCRSYCFTSYEYVEAELENTLSFAFSKYISSEFNTLWRFDDNRGRHYYDDNLGYFQFKEYFTLGLSYNF